MGGKYKKRRNSNRILVDVDNVTGSDVDDNNNILPQTEKLREILGDGVSDEMKLLVHNECAQFLADIEVVVCSYCNQRRFTGDMSESCEDKCESCETGEKEGTFKDLNLYRLEAMPEELRDLSVLEKLMISRAHLQCTIVKIGFFGSGECTMKALKKHSIAFPLNESCQSRNAVELSLPYSPAQIAEGCLLRVMFYRGDSQLSAAEERKLKEAYRSTMIVRKEKVIGALKWKIANDVHYKNVMLNHHVVNTLPQEALITYGLLEEFHENAQYEESMSSQDESIDVAYLPVVFGEDADRNAWGLIGKALKIVADPTPMSEHNFIKYYYSTFPCLFPKGNELDGIQSLHEMIELCMHHRDDRFRKEASFYFSVYSQLQRQKINQQCRMRVTRAQSTEILNNLRSITNAEWISIARDLENGMCLNHIDQSIGHVLRDVTLISQNLRNSFGRKKEMRNELRSMVTRYGQPMIWFTIAPNDIVNPLVIRLGGKNAEEFSGEARRLIACNDPSACVEFFHIVVIQCVNILQRLCGVDYYYGVIEAQNRGTLHLHLIGFNTRLRNVDLSEEDWIALQDLLISAQVVTRVPHTEMESERILGLLSEDVKIAQNYEDIVENASELSQSFSTNLHDPRHRKSCFKKDRKGNNGSCRYKFPRDEEAKSFINELYEIIPKRNHRWLNPYNPLLMSLFHCNHDIKLLLQGSSEAIFGLLYYLTNYATKNELSYYNIVDIMATAHEQLMKQLENNVSTVTFNRRFYIRILTLLTGRKEISSNLVMNELLKYNDNVHNVVFTKLNYSLFLNHALGRNNDVYLEENEDIDLHGDGLNIRVSKLVDYLYRSNEYKDMSPYEFCLKTYKVKNEKKRKRSKTFLEGHPQCESHILCRRLRYENVVVDLVGNSTYSWSNARYAFLCYVIFTPWDRNMVFQSYEEISYEEIISHILEDIVVPIERKELMRNFFLMRKGQVYVQQNHSETHTAVNEETNNNIVNENIEVNLHEEDQHVVEDFDADENVLQVLQFRGLRASLQDLNALSNIRESVLNYLDPVDESVRTMIHDFENSNTLNYVGFPPNHLSIPDVLTACEHKIDAFEQILLNVCEKHNLDTIQSLSVCTICECRERQINFVLSGEAGTGKSAVIHAVVECLELWHWQSGREVIVCGSTGSAASKFNGPTLHKVCGLGVYNASAGVNGMNQSVAKLRRKYGKLRCLIVDEYSMVPAQLLAKVDRMLRLVKRTDILFGGVSLIFAGDFYQLPPVQSTALSYNGPIVGRHADVVMGLEIWRNINEGIVLEVNYRQSDPVYLNLLRKWKKGEMREPEWNLLKSRVLGPDLRLDRVAVNDITCIVRTHRLKNIINDSFVERFGQDIEIYDALDSSTTANLELCADELRNLNDNTSKLHPGSLHLYTNCKVVVCHNYDTSAGIAKGTKGYVHTMQPDVITICVKGRNGHFLYNIERIPISFTLQGHSITRKQFALNIGFAITDFRAQGDTLDQAIIDIRGANYYSIYVMLSRVRSLAGLYILADFDIRSLSHSNRVPLSLNAEVQRLQSISKESIAAGQHKYGFLLQYISNSRAL